MMKYGFLIAVFFLSVVSLSQAQAFHQALGARVGTTTGISYKEFVNGPKAYELILGEKLDRGVFATALYQYHFNIGYYRNGLDWYLGAGSTLGYLFSNESYHIGVGVVGCAGLEYTFPQSPFCIAIDVLPGYGLNMYPYWEAGLTVRYVLEPN